MNTENMEQLMAGVVRDIAEVTQILQKPDVSDAEKRLGIYEAVGGIVCRAEYATGGINLPDGLRENLVTLIAELFVTVVEKVGA